ncbi:hypothetical protein BVY11_26815 [Pseudomonas amygdali pv. morsprunorum]|nr:hypothetical protein BVY11_26815 [Pseudomonas amygdali pv. morsprunorum]
MVLLSVLKLVLLTDMVIRAPLDLLTVLLLVSVYLKQMIKSAKMLKALLKKTTVGLSLPILLYLLLLVVVLPRWALLLYASLCLLVVLSAMLM